MSTNPLASEQHRMQQIAARFDVYIQRSVPIKQTHRRGSSGVYCVCVVGVEGYSSIRSSTQLHLCKPHTHRATNISVLWRRAVVMARLCRF